MPEWVEAYRLEALAAPITLDNALKYHWYQIGVGIRAQHPMVYDIDIAPAVQQMRRHGNAATEELKRQLDDRFAAISSLERAGPATAACTWVMARERGEGPTQLQIDLDSHCREHAAPALYARLVRERAEGLDVRLATLPSLSVDYPDRLVGASGFVGGANVPAAYAAALDQRLAKAQPSVIAELAATFAARPGGDGVLATDVAQCRELLGRWYLQGDPVRDMMLSDPLRRDAAGTEAAMRFGQAVGLACRREARAWLRRQRPKIEAAIRTTFAGLDPKRGPLLAVGTRCSGVLGRWFPTFDGFEITLTGPLQQACREEAQRLNERGYDIRAHALAARFAAAPKSLDGLERNNWFSASDDDLQSAQDPRDLERAEVDRILRTRTEALVQPLRDVARDAALREIRSLYEHAGLGEADLEPARRACGPYLGRTTRALPPGGTDLRKDIGAACGQQESHVAFRRAKAAVDAAGIQTVLGKGRLFVETPDGRLAYAEPRAVVIAAAGNGLQVGFRRTRSWLLWTKESLHVTPFGSDKPTLVGELTPEADPAGERVWRVRDLQILPGLDGSFTTLACLTQGPEATQALIGLGLAGLASIFVLDLPRTGGELIWAAGTLTTTMGQCESARRSYFGVPSPSVP